MRRRFNNHVLHLGAVFYNKLLPFNISSHLGYIAPSLLKFCCNMHVKVEESQEYGKQLIMGVFQLH